MKRLFLIAGTVASLSSSVAAQETACPTCKDCAVDQLAAEIAHKAYQFSSIAIDEPKNICYLPTEKCGIIFKCDLKNRKVLQAITLDFSKTDDKSIEIEGAALFGQLLLLTNEQKNKHHSIYCIDLAAVKNNIAKIIPVLTDKDEILNTFTGLSGIEGITVDPTNHVCYVLREKDHNSHSSQMFSFNISQKGNALVFKSVDKIRIYHSEQHANDSTRYTDLFYHANSLYCIESSFVTTGDRQNGYFLDKLKVNNAGQFMDREKNGSGRLRWKCLTNFVNVEHKDDENNIEGISGTGDSLYIISDNAVGKPSCDSIITSTTLFFHLPYGN